MNSKKRNKKEVTIKRGSFFKLLRKVNENWVQIETESGEIGLVPQNYVSFFEQEIRCSALYKFKAQTSRQISFEKVIFAI